MENIKSESVKSALEGLKDAETESHNEEKVPAGYVAITLSTEGKFHRAPALFHMRNFDITESLKLGGIEKKDIPIKVPEMINKLFLEEGLDINDFLDVEATETMARFYAAFYQTKIPDLEYKVKPEDEAWVLENVYKGDAENKDYLKWVRDINNGNIKALYDVDLTQLDFYDLPNDCSGIVKYKKGDFSFKFQLPRFGDSATIQRAIQNEFGERDKRYGQTYQNFQRNQELDAKKERGENIADSAYKYIPESELTELKAYELEKTAYALTLMKGLYLVELNGEDVSKKKLSERVELANKESRLDYCAFQTISEYFDKIKIGIKPEVKVARHPITGKPGVVEHPFRALELLTYIRNFRSDGCDITLE